MNCVVYVLVYQQCVVQVQNFVYFVYDVYWEFCVDGVSKVVYQEVLIINFVLYQVFYDVGYLY